MKASKLKQLEDEQLYQDNFNELPPADIVAFNELRSCADLFRLYNTQQLEIQPEFQREIVWSKPEQTRFIDSLIKQLPIPSMCISLDYRTEKRLVIDGLQRIKSIINFFSDDNWRLSYLEDIDSRLSGKTVREIRHGSPELYERLFNVMIPVTVIRCDYSKKSHSEFLFTIFHRLNSGGVRLNSQEIRNCIYNGSFNILLKELAAKVETKKIFGNRNRFANEEMILRFFAFNDRLNDYTGSLSKFLNDYMFEHRDLDLSDLDHRGRLYSKVVDIAYYRILDKVPSVLSRTFAEGLLYGILKNIDYLIAMSDGELKGLYQGFKQLPEYSMESLQEGLSVKEKVIDRLSASERYFAK